MARKRSPSRPARTASPRPQVPLAPASASAIAAPSWRISVALFVIAVAAVAVTRAMPFFSAAQAAHPELRFAANGKEYPYLIGQDSYSWVRKARNYLANGSPCDIQVAGDCRDLLRHAPVGSTMPYADSLHPLAIAWLHRMMKLVDPQRPLETSAFWLQVVVGALGVLPAWLIGHRLGGVWGGFFAAVVIGLNENFLERSLGADNDVWNVVLPLFAAWAILQALGNRPSWQRLGATIGAAAVVALHAEFWSGWIFTFLVLTAGVLASLLWSAAHLWAREDRHAALAEVRALALVACCFFAATWLMTRGQTSEWQQVRSKILEAVARSAPQPAKPQADDTPLRAEFPDGLRNIGELQVLSFATVGERLGGRPLLFGSVFGLLLLVMPRKVWDTFECALAAAGAGVLATAVWLAAPPALLAAALAVPIVLILGRRLSQRDSEPASSVQGAMLIAAWLGAALSQSLSGQRYMLLAVAPLGLAFGAGAGWVVQRLREHTRQPLLAWAAAAALTALVATMGQQGFAYANHALPKLNDAWADSLAELRSKSPQDAIINAWWPYGYWIEYHAERGVAADGSSVLKRIPHWMGRALLAADEKEAMGLLRMLNCGSDASPEPEGRSSAYEKLLAAGANGFAAHDIIVELAGLDRGAADVFLAGLGYPDAVRAGILAATHCAARPAYLLLSDKQMRQVDVRYQGNWDLRRAAIAHQLRTAPEANAITAIVDQLGFTEKQARAMYEAVHSLSSEADLDRFITTSFPYITGWLPCRADASGRRVCAINQKLGEGLTLEGFAYTGDKPDRGVILFREGDRSAERPPETIVVSDAQGVRTVELSGTTTKGYAVLLDTRANRAMIGPPYLVRSLLSRLEFLDTQPLRYFEKAGDHHAADERVVTWRIHWPEADDGK